MPPVDAVKLRRMPLFGGLTDKQLARVARWSDEIDVSEGTHLLDEGRFPHEFLVVLEGEVEVQHDGEQLAVLGPGDILGEIAILEGLRRTATVVATTPVNAAVMHERDFLEMCEELPSVAEHVRANVHERLRASHRDAGSHER